MIFPLEFSFSQFFGRNVLLFTLVSKLTQPFLEKLILAVVGEYLMLAPCIVVLNWQQTIITLGADSFIMHISCYFMLLTLGTCQRLFYGPFISQHWDEWGFRLHQLLVQLGARSEDEDALEQRRQKEMLKSKNPDTPERTSAELMEPLFEAVTIITAETMSHLLEPVVLWVLSQFVVETNITRSFDVTDHHISYYMVFGVIMTVASRITDMVQLSLMENIFGWRMFDFMNYMNFRFDNRHQMWKADEVNPDSNLPHSMHTIDKMCFSSQYYIMITLSCTIPHPLDLCSCVSPAFSFSFVDSAGHDHVHDWLRDHVAESGDCFCSHLCRCTGSCASHLAIRSLLFRSPYHHQDWSHAQDLQIT
jgi:hypothetical protein